MAQINAADVKRLRDETDAPMMECKEALVEADGDMERARQILREKGKAAAGKRAGRATSEGVALLVTSPDHKAVGGIVLECETDFVAKNESFLEVANQLAGTFVTTDPGDDPSNVMSNGKLVADIVEESVAKIRENIQLAKAVHMAGGGEYAVYVHHDKKKAAAVEVTGSASNKLEVAHKVAVQVVAMRPVFVRKDEISQDFIDEELRTETQRAINEGKNPDIAKNIALGRFNKETVRAKVLLEQEFFADSTKSVGQYVQEQAKAGGGEIEVRSFTMLAVGED